VRRVEYGQIVTIENFLGPWERGNRWLRVVQVGREELWGWLDRRYVEPT
jgi:hypothetical protein